MFDSRALDGTQRLVDDWQAGFEHRAAQAQLLAGRLAVATASARSSDGLVEVTVGPSGAVADLHLDEAIRRRSAERTAQEIMATIAAARAALAELAAAAVADTVGTDSEVGRAVLSSYQRAGQP
jgi:DNA-binding protein YbaB